MTTLLIASLLLQTKGAEETTLLAAGSPRLGFPAGQSGLVTPETHSVTLTVTKQNVNVESITNYRCQGPTLGTPLKPQIAKAPLEMPVMVEGWTSKFGTPWTATWSNAPVQFQPGLADPSSGGPERYTRWHRAQVEVPPSGTKTLVARTTLPLQVVGLDGKQRRLVYRLDRMNGVRQINLSIKHAPGVVFQNVRVAPKELNWKTGPSGSFAQINNYNQDRPTMVEFVFYPDGF